jgi:hypothetical protein
MPIAFADDSASISTTEYFLASDSTTATYQTTDCILQAYIHIASMAAGDQYEVKVYEKVNAQGPQLIYYAVLDGAQANPLVTPSLIVGDGWEVSVKKLAGTDRTVHWSLRKIT